MPKKSKYTKAKADTLFSKIVRLRDRCCVICGTMDNLQCAHGFTRNHYPTRWDEDNAWALCRGHHVYYTHQPILWDDWMREKLGDEKYQELRMKAIGTTGRTDYKELIERLEERLAQFDA